MVVLVFDVFVVFGEYVMATRHFFFIAAVFVSCQVSAEFLPPAAPVTDGEIFVIDLQTASSDEKLAATTLQGLVNRDEAKLYVLLAKWDAFWLKQIKSTKQICSINMLSLEEAFAKFGSNIKKVFKYDPQLSDSINLATMMAAIEDGIVVAPDMPFAWQESAEVVDLKDRWSSSAEAYRWALDNLLERMSGQVLACYHPTACSHHLRDYLVAHKVFHFWVDSADASGVNKDARTEEMQVFEHIMQKTKSNIPVLGFWYSGVDPGLDEYYGVGLAGQYGKITVVSDWSSNLSFLGGCKADVRNAVTQYNKQITTTPPPLAQDNIYICFDVVESGDAPSYLQSRLYEVWQDEERGTVPINWSLGPTVFDLAPSIASYYYNEASSNDYIYMAISGAGYCHPFRELFSKTTQPEKCWENYLTTTNGYLLNMQSTVLGLYTDAWKPFVKKDADTILKRFIQGLGTLDAIILGMGRDENIDRNAPNYYLQNDNETVISHIMTRWPVDYAKKTYEENIDWLVNDIKMNTPDILPGFMHVMALSWAYTPSDIVLVLNKLGNRYIPLNIPQYNALVRQNMTIKGKLLEH